MKDFWDEFGEIIGDCFIIALGLLLIYIFVLIEVFHFYGVEPNKYIRWFELVFGIPTILLGINRFIGDIRRRGDR